MGASFSSDGVLDRFFLKWVDGKIMRMYGQKLFFGHKENWVLMKFGGRKFKVCENTMDFWTEIHKVSFLLEFSVSSLAIFSGCFFFHVPLVMDNGVLFIGKTLWIFEHLKGANIM